MESQELSTPLSPADHSGTGTVMRLSELASRLNLDYTGDDFQISGINSLEDAGPDQLSFLAGPRYAHLLNTTRAGVVITDPEHASKISRALISQNPYLDFARTVGFFDKPQGLLEDNSSHAFIHESARIDPSAVIHPMAYIGPGAAIGKNTRVFPFVYIGENSLVGDDCIIYPSVSIMASSVLGNRVIVHSGAVIGSDGFGFAPVEKSRKKIPQIGIVEVGDDVEIGACTTIDRATLGKTVIGKGTKIDNLVQVAHNVHIGENCVLIAQVGISGSSRLGRNVILGGQTALAGHLEIGDNSRVAAKSGVAKSIPPNKDFGGIPAMEHSSFLKNAVLMPKLHQLFKRVKKLENEIETMRQNQSKGETK